jgi:hypothetical protein
MAESPNLIQGHAAKAGEQVGAALRLPQAAAKAGTEPFKAAEQLSSSIHERDSTTAV